MCCSACEWLLLSLVLFIAKVATPLHVYVRFIPIVAKTNSLLLRIASKIYSYEQTMVSFFHLLRDIMVTSRIQLLLIKPLSIFPCSFCVDACFQTCWANLCGHIFPTDGFIFILIINEDIFSLPLSASPLLSLDLEWSITFSEISKVKHMACFLLSILSHSLLFPSPMIFPFPPFYFPFLSSLPFFFLSGLSTFKLAWTCCVADNNLTLLILMHLPLKCWD